MYYNVVNQSIFWLLFTTKDFTEAIYVIIHEIKDQYMIIKYNANDTIRNIKHKIADKYNMEYEENINFQNYCVIYNGNILVNNKTTIQQYNIHKEATLHLVQPLCYICGKTIGVQRCAQCKKSFYCSKRCQLKDWARHSKQCNKQTKSL